jgi:hypothetical protein
MKKMLTSLIFLCASELAHAENFLIVAADSYFNRDYSTDSPPGGICFGGELCGKNDQVTVLYMSSSSNFLTNVNVRAHDHVGDKFKAHLQLWADGVLIGEKDVSKNGSWLNFQLDRNVFRLEFRSVHERGAAGGDETVITWIQTY